MGNFVNVTMNRTTTELGNLKHLMNVSEYKRKILSLKLKTNLRYCTDTTNNALYNFQYYLHYIEVQK